MFGDMWSEVVSKKTEGLRANSSVSGKRGGESCPLTYLYTPPQCLGMSQLDLLNTDTMWVFCLLSSDDVCYSPNFPEMFSQTEKMDGDLINV